MTPPVQPRASAPPSVGAQPRQPFLHDLVTAFAAPTQVLSAPNGDVISSIDGASAQGVLHADVRVVSDLRLTVDGQPPEHIATSTGEGAAEFTAVARRLATPMPAGADPSVRLDRRRRVEPGRVHEVLVLSSVLEHPVELSLQVSMSSDFAPMEDVKCGLAPAAVDLAAEIDSAGVSWRSGTTTVRLDPGGAEVDLSEPRRLLLTWPLTVPARGSTTVGCTLSVQDAGSVVVAPVTPALDVRSLTAGLADRVAAAGVVEPRLRPWLQRSLSDLNSLQMATAEHPGDTFFAAGAPWYLTLFGRDSLWTARMLLPLDVEHVGWTLRVLARLQGTSTDPGSAEAPGKIMHELRRGQYAFGEISLPPLYYGTIDATPLWVCLLHDAWRAGLAPDAVRELLPALEAALDWLSAYGDADGDGFCEYVDESGRGLANQGWKDSADAVRFADGSRATGPVALCEVQGYAYEAATSGAVLLEAFGRPGAARHREWAARLAARFREQFWCGEGEERYPALALDGRKQRVDSVTSNIGHLVGTGLLSAEEELLVARRLARDDLDSGLGLRTMSTADGGYSPLSYHCGSVWPHDTAIVVRALAGAGLLEHAAGLIEGLLAASVAFDQRLPELWSGEGRPVPYPAACRPQAWSAAAAVVVGDALARGGG